jgi:ABC-type transport system substrate-binding protein
VKISRIDFLSICKKIVCICIFCLVAGAAAAEEAVFFLDTSPDRLTPIFIRSPKTFPVSMQIYEGLFGLDKEGRVIPKLIERWETTDYQTWRFHVRKNAYFHSSPIFENHVRLVTAEDVAYSLQQFCRPDSYNSFLLLDSVKGAAEFNQGKSEKVSGIKVVDPMVVEIELIKPERFFINRLSTNLICVYPREMDQERHKDEVGFNLAIGTGPYRLASYTETEIILEKNKTYWDTENRANIDRWVFRVVKNDQNRIAGLKRGTVDLMVLPNSLFPSVLEKNGTLKKPYRKNYQLEAAKTYNSHLIGFNLSKITDPDLRRAMFLATDRKQIIDTLLYGFADETGGTIPPGMNGYQPPTNVPLFDLKLAKRHIAKSSYKGEALELMVHDIDNSELVGQIFQAQMAKIGVRVKLKKLDFGGAITHIVKGDVVMFSMFFEYVFSAPEPALINLFSSAKIPVPNFFHYSNTEVDRKLEALYQMPTADGLIACQEVEAQVMKDAPAIFLYRQQYALLHSKKLANVQVTGNNYYLLEKVTSTQKKK